MNRYIMEIRIEVIAEDYDEVWTKCNTVLCEANKVDSVGECGATVQDMGVEE